jgi:hypothetical protein
MNSLGDEETITLYRPVGEGAYNPSHKCLEPRSLILTVSLLWFNFRIARHPPAIGGRLQLNLPASDKGTSRRDPWTLERRR